MPLRVEDFWNVIESYRQETHRFLPELRISSDKEAIAFVNQRKFVFFWPIKNIPLPSLWGAAAGNRPVPNNHDDPGHITWRWKDDLLDKSVWYYAKVLRKKSTIISLDTIRFFFALSETVFHQIGDLEYLYKIGKIPRIELEIFSQLVKHGPLDSISLREHLYAKISCSSAEFNRGMLHLQEKFQIIPVGIAEKGRWHYAYLYDRVARQFPNEINIAYQMLKEEAREKLLLAYFASIGAATIQDTRKLFRWSIEDINQTLVKFEKHSLVLPVKSDEMDQLFVYKDLYQKI